MICDQRGFKKKKAELALLFATELQKNAVTRSKFRFSVFALSVKKRLGEFWGWKSSSMQMNANPVLGKNNISLISPLTERRETSSLLIQTN